MIKSGKIPGYGKKYMFLAAASLTFLLAACGNGRTISDETGKESSTSASGLEDWLTEEEKPEFAALREINPELRIKGLVTMRQKNKTSLDFEEWMKTSSGFDMFVTPIRRSIVAEKASMRMAVLPQFSKNCIVSQDYRNVVHELLKEMEG